MVSGTDNLNWMFEVCLFMEKSSVFFTAVYSGTTFLSTTVVLWLILFEWYLGFYNEVATCTSVLSTFSFVLFKKQSNVSVFK